MTQKDHNNMYLQECTSKNMLFFQAECFQLQNILKWSFPAGLFVQLVYFKSTAEGFRCYLPASQSLGFISRWFDLST